jgi:oxygen-independent coproporphyrinogen-3 oxidase
MYSLYFHIPFCRSRCGYCDFNTYAGLERLIPAYLHALEQEIGHAALQAAGRLKVHTLFFGGGTPSLLPLAGLERILSAVRAAYDLDPLAEVTLEANPGTLSFDYLQGLKALGVNRLSLGMQSARPEELRLLERQHTYPEVIQAAAWARQAGLENFNLDLIFGLPHQDLESWAHSLEMALNLHPAHLSLYALTVEHGTPLQRWIDRGLLADPDPDLAADMYEHAAGRLEQAGYLQYEISNWARLEPARLSELGSSFSSGCYAAAVCQHNLQYWRGLPYLGFGAGAHGYAAGVRTENVLSPAAYIQRMQQPGPEAGAFPLTPAAAGSRVVGLDDEIAETMMMGLRLVEEGISTAGFETRFGMTLEHRFSQEIEELTRLGLLEWRGSGVQRRLRLSPRGRLLGNQVFMRFV